MLLCIGSKLPLLHSYATTCLVLSRVNDCVLKVNNVDLTNVEYNTAVQVMSDSDVLKVVSICNVYL